MEEVEDEHEGEEEEERKRRKVRQTEVRRREARMRKRRTAGFLHGGGHLKHTHARLPCGRLFIEARFH